MCHKNMKKKLCIPLASMAVAALLPAMSVFAADTAPLKDTPRSQSESVTPPKAAEPVKPGTMYRMPQSVAPGTADTPKKPIAPGTLDRNVINPDVKIQKGLKPVPR